MQSLEREVRTAINSIHDELAARERKGAAGDDVWSGARSSDRVAPIISNLARH